MAPRSYTRTKSDIDTEIDEEIEAEQIVDEIEAEQIVEEIETRTKPHQKKCHQVCKPKTNPNQR